MRVLHHRRVRRAISRYADGELDARSAQAVADHLLECDGCSHELAMVVAIKGSLGRLASTEPPTLAAARLRRRAAGLHGLRGLAISEPRDQVRLAVAAAVPEPIGGVRTRVQQARPNRGRAWVGALVGILAAIVVTDAVPLHRQGPSPDPALVAAVVELARIEPPTRPMSANGGRGQPPGRMVELGDQKVWLARHLVDGREVLIATSDRAFPMPANARPLGRERNAPWLAVRDDLGIACLSRPAHRLLVGNLPAERLVEIGRQLGPL
ncbi:MAG: zf-HC2 domain-containing protein [bacterium]